MQRMGVVRRRAPRCAAGRHGRRGSRRSRRSSSRGGARRTCCPSPVRRRRTRRSTPSGRERAARRPRRARGPGGSPRRRCRIGTCWRRGRRIERPRAPCRRRWRAATRSRPHRSRPASYPPAARRLRRSRSVGRQMAFLRAVVPRKREREPRRWPKPAVLARASAPFLDAGFASERPAGTSPEILRRSPGLGDGTEGAVCTGGPRRRGANRIAFAVERAREPPRAGRERWLRWMSSTCASPMVRWKSSTAFRWASRTGNSSPSSVRPAAGNRRCCA